MRYFDYKCGIILVIFQIQFWIANGNFAIHPEEGTLQQLTPFSYPEIDFENNSPKKKTSLTSSKRFSAKSNSLSEASEVLSVSKFSNKNYALPSPGQYVSTTSSSGAFSETGATQNGFFGGHSTSMATSQGHSLAMGPEVHSSSNAASHSSAFSNGQSLEVGSMGFSESSAAVRNGFIHENNPAMVENLKPGPFQTSPQIHNGFVVPKFSVPKTYASSETYGNSIVYGQHEPIMSSLDVTSLNSHSLASSKAHSSPLNVDSITQSYSSSDAHSHGEYVMSNSGSFSSAQISNNEEIHPMVIANMAPSSTYASSGANVVRTGYFLPKPSVTKTQSISETYANSNVEAQPTHYTPAVTSANSYTSAFSEAHSGSSGFASVPQIHNSPEVHLMNHFDSSGIAQSNLNQENNPVVTTNMVSSSSQTSSEANSVHGGFFRSKFPVAQTHSSSEAQGSSMVVEHKPTIQTSAITSLDSYSAAHSIGHSSPGGVTSEVTSNSYSDAYSSANDGLHHDNYPLIENIAISTSEASAEANAVHGGFFLPKFAVAKTQSSSEAHANSMIVPHEPQIHPLTSSSANSHSSALSGSSTSFLETSGLEGSHGEHSIFPILNSVSHSLSGAHSESNSPDMFQEIIVNENQPSHMKNSLFETRMGSMIENSLNHENPRHSYFGQHNSNYNNNEEIINEHQSYPQNSVFGTRVTSISEHSLDNENSKQSNFGLYPSNYDNVETESVRITNGNNDFSSLFDFSENNIPSALFVEHLSMEPTHFFFEESINNKHRHIEPSLNDHAILPEIHHLVEVFSENLVPETHNYIGLHQQTDPILAVPEEKHHLFEHLLDHKDIFSIDKHNDHLIIPERHHMFDVSTEIHHPIEIHQQIDPILTIPGEKHHIFENLLDHQKLFSIENFNEEPHLVFTHNGARLPVVDLLEMINKHVLIHPQPLRDEKESISEIPVPQQKYFGPLHHFSVFELLNHVHDHSEKLIPFEDIFSEIVNRAHHFHGLDDHISLISDVLASDFFEKMSSLDHIFVNHHENYLSFMDSIFGYYHLGSTLMHHGHNIISEHQTALHTPKIRALFDLYHVLTEKILDFTEMIIHEGLEIHGECKYGILKSYLFDKRNGWVDIIQSCFDYMKKHTFLLKILIRNENAVGFENYFSHLMSKNTELLDRSLVIFQKSYPIVLRHGFDQALLGHSMYLSRVTTTVSSIYKFINNFMVTIDTSSRQISLGSQIIDDLFHSCAGLVKRMVQLTSENYSNYNTENNFGIENVGPELIFYVKNSIVEVVKAVEHILKFAENIIHSNVGLTSNENSLMNFHESRLDNLLEISNSFISSYLTYLSTVMNNPYFISFFKDYSQFESINYFDAVLMDSHKILDRLLYFIEISYEKTEGNIEHIHLIIPNIHTTNSILKNYVYIVDRATHTIPTSETEVFKHFSECKNLADRMNNLIEYMVTGKSISLVRIVGAHDEEHERKMSEFRSYYQHNPWTYLFHDHHVKHNENVMEFVQHLMHHKNGETTYSVLLEDQGELYRHNLQADSRMGLKREISEHIFKHFLHKEMNLKDLKYDEDYHLSFCLPITKRYFNEYLMIENKNTII